MAENTSSRDMGLNIEPYKAYGETTGLKGVLAGGEILLRQGRKESGEVKSGMFKSLEGVLKFLGAVTGNSQVGKEVDAFNTHVSNLENQSGIFDGIKAKEFDAKDDDGKAEFLSAGMESVKKTASELIEIRRQAPELNGKVVVDGLANMGKEFVAASTEDIEAIDTFVDGMKSARKDALKKMGKMWDAKESMDSVHKVREIVDIGKEIDREDQYEFAMESGVIRQIRSVARRLLPGGVKRIGQIRYRAGVAAQLEADSRLNDLRADALRVGGAAEDVQMWKLGIVSRKELADVDVDELISKGVKLSETEEKALRDNTELSDFMKQQKGAKAGVMEFRRASQDKQVAYFEKWYGGDLKPVLENGQPVVNIDGSPKMERVGGIVGATEKDFNIARDAYLQFDLRNAGKWDEKGIVLKSISAADKAGFDTDAIGVTAEVITIPIPAFMKKWGAYFTSIGAEGMITMSKVPGGAFDFGIDHMESTLAGDAIERFASVMVARESALNTLQKLVSSDTSTGLSVSKDLLDAAMAVKGSESAMMRAAAYAARVRKEIGLTFGKGTLKGMGNALGELPLAAAEKVAGGFGWGGEIDAVFKDLKDRAILQDGKTIMDKHGAGKVGEVGQRHVENMAADLGIPAEYMTNDGLKEHLNSSIFMRAAELLRKQITLDGDLLGIGKAFHLDTNEGWQVLAGGSKRQTVEDLSKTMNEGLARAERSFVKLSKSVDSMPEQDRGVKDDDTIVEVAATIVLKEAKDKLAESELNQIKKRSQLDTMWSKVLGFGPKALVLAGVGILVSQGGGVVEAWADKAHVYAGEATNNLHVMQEGFDKVMKIAQEQGMHVTKGGANIDLMWKEFLNGIGGANETVANFTSTNFLKIKLAALITTMAAPIAAVAPAAYAFVTAQVKSKFMAETGNIT